MLKTPANIKAAQAILAVAQAHARMPGADRARAVALAEQLDRVLANARQLDGFVALSIVMLKQLGVADVGALTAAAGN